MNKYNVYDECKRLIEENVNLKRARSTVKANPGSKLIELDKPTPLFKRNFSAGN